MEKSTKVIPALKIQPQLYDDLERVLKAMNYRRTDYIRRVLADAVRRDLGKVRANDQGQ